MHIFAAVPAYNGTMLVETTDTLFAISNMARARGWQFTFAHQLGSPISLVRNALAAAFLASDADVLLMLDADQAVDPQMVARMIDLGQPVVGAILPKRFYDWSAVSVPISDPRQAVHQAMKYAGSLLADEHGNAQINDGFALAEQVGGGILLIRREALLALKQAYPELAGTCLHVEAWPHLANQGAWGFFNPIPNGNGAPLAEDISFSHRWRQAGGSIWADVTSPIAHIGHWSFTGSFYDHLMASGRIKT